MREAIREIALLIIVGAASFVLGMQHMADKAGITLPIPAPRQLPRHTGPPITIEPDPVHMTGGPVTQLAKDFRAICLWENRGVIRDQYHKTTHARGPAQIRPCYLHDANEWLASKGLATYTHDEMGDYNKSFAVFCAYMARYGKKTTEERARAHYGGPRGDKKECTLEYWKGVQSYVGK